MSAQVDAVESLLAERPEDAARRASEALGVVAGRDGGPVVLFGAGNLGRRTLATLRSSGTEVLAFADNNEKNWGRVIEGVPVRAPADAVKAHPDALFVVSIWGAGHSHRYPATRAQLGALGARHVAPWAALAWRKSAEFLPYFALDLPQNVLHKADRVRAGFAALSTDEARAEFLGQLRWRLHLDYGALVRPRHHARQYFEDDLFTPRGDDVFVDCGAYTGDSLDAFLAFSGGSLRHGWLAEPDPENHAKLVTHLAAAPEAVRTRIVAANVAVGAASGTITIDATGTAASATGKGGLEVPLVALDDVAWPALPTFVKMDIEGAELDALAGAKRTISAGLPLMAVCSYHRQDHLWEVPARLAELLPGHALHLRSYSEECYDLVCYAVPPSRKAP